MKKKFIVSFLFSVVMLYVMAIKVFATNYETSHYSFYLPNDYEVDYEKDSEKESYNSYATDKFDSFTAVMFNAFYYDNLESYEKTDLDSHIQRIKKLYSDGSALKEIKGEMTELNGVKGYKLTYVLNYSSQNLEYGHIIYKLRSDNYEYEIAIDANTSYLNSSEVQTIINSFKIKDSLRKSGALPFLDVSQDAWYYNAAKYVYTNNIIAGYDNGNFGPEDKLTRGQLITILHRMEGSPKATGKKQFPDVQDSKQYYYNAVRWGTDKNIISGYNDGNFGPEDNITREQLAVILNRYAKYKGKDISVTDSLSRFKDTNKISSYAVNQMKWAVGAGVITGNSDKTLNPGGNATRAEVAAMLEKYCKKVGR